MWGNEFPRLFDLYSNSDKNSSDNYFANFSEIIKNNLACKYYSSLEKQLSQLSETAWEQLKNKALPYVIKRDRQRDYQQLFDTLNESYGFLILNERCYKSVQFIDTDQNTQTPDLKAENQNGIVLLEVKTINRSDFDNKWIENRNSQARGGTFELTKILQNKLKCTLEIAKDQLKSFHDQGIKVTKRIALLLINFDSDFRLTEEMKKELKSFEAEEKECEVIVKVIFGL